MSILRLRSVVRFSLSGNKTWNFFDVTLWSGIELTVAIMCACLPAARLLLVRLFPHLAGTSGSTSKEQGGSIYGPKRSQTRSSRHRLSNPAGKSGGSHDEEFDLRGTSAFVSTADKRRSGSSNPDQGIRFQQTYAVEHSDGDEGNLVPRDYRHRAESKSHGRWMNKH